MVDITTVNSKIRKHLDNNGYDRVDVGPPFFDGGYWFATITSGDMLLGVVILDPLGKVIIDKSFPDCS
jgi:hypothetical protein